jgi:hypothetical protein
MQHQKGVGNVDTLRDRPLAYALALEGQHLSEKSKPRTSGYF